MIGRSSKHRRVNKKPSRVRRSSGMKGLFARLAGTALRLAVILFVISLAAILFLRFFHPVTSAFMMERYCKGLFTPGKVSSTRFDWVDLQEISPQMPLAVVAAEDQKFPNHFGFDFQSISDALEERSETGRVRGASTITQQVAKNLFLWKGKNFIRKGMEAYFTVMIETFWPKRRILEIYLNIAEFGEGIYGVEAAARKYFGKPASQLTRRESAILAAVLPNPARLKVDAPSHYVTRRARKIEIQMRNLGPSYLKDI